jgi:glycosyltransferase involved in cell wall biosynthesis
MTKNSAPTPWISFCIATYKRQELLAKTLVSIQQQLVTDFEVIISDNDPEQSSKFIVENMQDQRFHYSYNQENLGMVKNFNQALQLARGEFVVMISDDDPPFNEDMLSILRALEQHYPGYGSYYGGCGVLNVDPDIANLCRNPLGMQLCLADLPPLAVRTFSSTEFPIAYLSNYLFPYVLWSAGMVRREIALEVGGMPDYGSPYLTDFGYICLVGSQRGCVTVNAPLGYQTVHNENFGRRECRELNTALQGIHRYLTQKMETRDDWPQIQCVLETFLSTWIVNHSAFLMRYFKFYGFGEQKLRITIWQIFCQVPYTRSIIWKPLELLFLPSTQAQSKHKARLCRGAALWNYGFVAKSLKNTMNWLFCISSWAESFEQL